MFSIFFNHLHYTPKLRISLYPDITCQNHMAVVSHCTYTHIPNEASMFLMPLEGNASELKSLLSLREGFLKMDVVMVLISKHSAVYSTDMLPWMAKEDCTLQLKRASFLLSLPSLLCPQTSPFLFFSSFFKCSFWR